jgi:TonB family protein
MKNLLVLLVILVSACSTSPSQRPEDIRRATAPTILRVLVKADGSIGPIQLKQSCGYPQCDRAAVEVVKNSSFAGVLNGDHVDRWVQIKVSDDKMAILK